MPYSINKSICYICYRDFPDTNFQYYSKTVSENGYDVTILSYLKDNQKEFEIIDKRKIFRFRLPKSKYRQKRILLFLIKSVKILNKNNFSIVHIHHTCKYFLLLKILSKKKSKYVFHITSFFSSKPKWRFFAKKLFIFIQCLFMDNVIIQSAELKENWLGIRSLKKTKIIPVGFSSKVFFPVNKETKINNKKRLYIDKDYPLLVYCGSIAKLREINKLLEGFKTASLLIRNIKLMMIGDGDALQDMKELAKNLKIDKQVIFTGKVDHQKLNNYFTAADIGISYVPVKIKYNFNPPLKTFEYLACGLPTIATNTLSNKKIIRNGYNGLLIQDTTEEIAKAIIGLIKNQKMQDIFKKNARVSVLENDFDYITKRNLIPLYQKLL